MDRDEIIEQAIRYLKAAQSNPVPFYHCPVCKLPAPGQGVSPEGQGHFPDCHLGKALSLLEGSEPAKAEPKPDDGEFTDKLRAYADWARGEPEAEMILEACDRFDNQAKEIANLKKEIEVLGDAYGSCNLDCTAKEQEIERLKAENKRLDRWHDYFAWEREMKKVEATNRRLVSENKKLTVERGHAQNGTHKALVEIDRLTEENAKLKETALAAQRQSDAHIAETVALAERIEAKDKIIDQLQARLNSIGGHC